MRDTFIIYTSSLEVLDVLNDEQAGLLFRAVRAYQSGNADDLDKLLSRDPCIRIAFLQFRQYFDRDSARYQDVCEKRAEIGRKGAAARWGNGKNGKSHSTDSKNGNCHISHDGKMANDSKAWQTMHEYESESDNDSDNKKKHTLTRMEKEGAADAATRTPETYDEFMSWLPYNCPYIFQHYKLPSAELLKKLFDRFGGEAVIEQCLNIENRADIRKRYTNLYQTLNNWLKREYGENRTDNTDGGRDERAEAYARRMRELAAEDDARRGA